MNDLLQSPEGFFDHIRRYTASVATTLVYGQRGATFDSFWAHVSRFPHPTAKITNGAEVRVRCHG